MLSFNMFYYNFVAVLPTFVKSDLSAILVDFDIDVGNKPKKSSIAWFGRTTKKFQYILNYFLCNILQNAHS